MKLTPTDPEEQEFVDGFIDGCIMVVLIAASIVVTFIGLIWWYEL